MHAYWHSTITWSLIQGVEMSKCKIKGSSQIIKIFCNLVPQGLLIKCLKTWKITCILVNEGSIKYTCNNLDEKLVLAMCIIKCFVKKNLAKRPMCLKPTQWCSINVGSLNSEKCYIHNIMLFFLWPLIWDTSQHDLVWGNQNNRFSFFLIFFSLEWFVKWLVFLEVIRQK